MSARVQVVDYDRTMSEMLLAYLRRAMYKTNWTTDGSEAHRLWQRDHPDVVILDDDPSDPRIVLTAGRSGYQLAEESEQR
jgi:DNA-binding response OmpR family regulator